MKAISNLKNGSHKMWPLYRMTIKCIIFSALFLLCIHVPLRAQEAQYTKPSWFFGGAVGANFNFYRGTTQELNNDITVPSAFYHGKGVGLYLAPLIEYHRPDTKLGFMLQVGYDNRSGKFNQVITPCNCPADLAIGLTYVTVEPSLRFAPFKSNFYVYAGPRLAFNKSKSFTYKETINPAYPGQVPNPDAKGDLSNVYNTRISMQVGAGIDIPLTSQNHRAQFVLSPFVAFQPYFGQSPRSIDTWTVTTLRAGVALKFGLGHKISTPSNGNPAMAEVIKDSKVRFSVNAPKNITVERRVREIFPLRNYVFFNLGSTEVPDRYVMLKKRQVKDFKEDQLEVFAPKVLSGRSEREMIVYYNVLNILGDRMEKNPTATITLVGSSEAGPEDGKAMAGSVKQYLVEIFGIDASRITIEGRNKPKIPSKQPGGVRELDLLREGDHRVSIESSSPVLLMEFQSGPEASLRPVEIISLQTAPLDSYVSFNADGANEAFTSWSLEIKDETGMVKYFGPFTQEQISIPGKSILGTRPEGDFKVTMVGITRNGKTVKKETSVHMVLWTPSKDEEGMRFSVLYEFNESKAITLYQKYLTNVVIPKIPKGALVIIHGHTDIIGDEAHNQKLSLARANDVRNIIENGLSKAGRNDVKFEVYGFGEDENLSPFENKFPEERFYNRTVIIDIIPQK